MGTSKAQEDAGEAPPTYEEATESGKARDENRSPSFEIITHLKLLFAFHKLRERIQDDETLFGLHTDWLPASTPEDIEASREIRQIVAQKRWDLFVKRAAFRFESWWESLRRDFGNKKFTIGDFVAKPRAEIDRCSKGPLVITKDSLPPLDVLMIWHSFLLSPRKYLEDCLLQGLMSLWHAKFPWNAINESIDIETGDYDPGFYAVKNFEKLHPWRNEDDECERELECPRCRCSSKIIVACSTFAADLSIAANQESEAPKSSVDLLQRTGDLLQSARGWADDGFYVYCITCQDGIDHDVLCAGKFINSVKSYATASSKKRSCAANFDVTAIWDQSPMPGTILSGFSGQPFNYRCSTSSYLSSRFEFFPNVLVETISHVDEDGGVDHTPKWQYRMKEVRRTLELALYCRHRMLYATHKRQRRADRLQRPYVRVMMAYYNDNPWKFTLDLASAVHRQAKFIDKMQHIDWLHSPAIEMTASRVITKYHRFLVIVDSDMYAMAVPTLDVDLAWHTDQLTPASYRQHTISVTERFVDHNDKVTEQKLSTAFAWTSKTYQRMWNEPYSECTCWYCEAMHASIERFPGWFHFGSRHRGYRRPKDEMLHNQSAPDADTTMAHISTHNAVRLQNPTQANKDAFKVHLAWLEKAYQRACKRARKEGRPPPVRRHPARDEAIDVGFTGYDSGTGGLNGKAAAVGLTAGAALGVGTVAIAVTADGGIAFEHEPECIDNRGTGGCVSGTCGSGVGWGGSDIHIDGESGACGDGGGTCAVDSSVIFFGANSARCGGGCGAGCGGGGAG